MLPAEAHVRSRPKIRNQDSQRGERSTRRRAREVIGHAIQNGDAAPHRPPSTFCAGDRQVNKARRNSRAPKPANKTGQEGAEQAEFLDPRRIVRLRFRQRRVIRVQLGPYDDVDDDEARQHEAGHEGRGEQRLDRGLGDEAENDQHDRRRDHGAQGAGGADRADREVLIVAQGAASAAARSDQAERPRRR